MYFKYLHIQIHYVYFRPFVFSLKEKEEIRNRTGSSILNDLCKTEVYFESFRRLKLLPPIDAVLSPHFPNLYNKGGEVIMTHGQNGHNYKNKTQVQIYRKFSFKV